ncbi:hypothetical protein CK203_027377 [Vitis vinifera]|uniref:Uncharacterized protein n=1 Tax=Vitis vinifera TaxID=29760 RepID=A0A438J9U2_VITVI|nr:hypothetical protein CK203_027377 [Vitis vinifera]
MMLWYARRFLHPDIVAPYDYIFIWDEDLRVEYFNAEEYIRLVRKYGLEISQPGLELNKELTWQMTKRREKQRRNRAGALTHICLPFSFSKCRFVEIMAPVFSRDAWRCVWHMLQNDQVHGWGLDFALRRCVEVLTYVCLLLILLYYLFVSMHDHIGTSSSLKQPAHEKIGVVDSQWIVHQTVPLLGNQGQAENGKAPWQGVRERCKKEWTMFRVRMTNAEKTYYKEMGINPTNSTAD